MPENQVIVSQFGPPAADPAAGQARPWIRSLLLALAALGRLAAAKLLGLGDRLGELRAWAGSLVPRSAGGWGAMPPVPACGA